MCISEQKCDFYSSFIITDYRQSQVGAVYVKHKRCDYKINITVLDGGAIRKKPQVFNLYLMTAIGTLER